MKRVFTVLVLLLVTSIWIVSCGSSSSKADSNDSKSTDTISTAPVEQPDITAQKTEQSAVQNESSNADLKKEEYLIISFPTYEDIAEKYPGKTVVTCLIGQVTMMDAYQRFRTWEINEYLDSIGSAYAVCFLPYKPDGKTFAEAVNGIKSGGKGVDIIIGSTHFGDENNVNIYHSDVFDDLYEPLDEYFERSEQGQKYLAMVPESFLDGFRVNGKLYAVGGLINKNLRASGYTINKELAEKYGWDYEKPVIKQIELLKAVRSGERDTDVVVVSNYGSVSYYPKNAAIDAIMGIYWDFEEECAQRITKSPEYLRGLEDIYYFKRSGVLMYGSSYSKAFIDLCKTIDYEDDCDEFTVSRGENTYTAINVATSDDYVINTVRGAGVYSGSMNKEAAFEVLMLLLNDPAVNNLLVYGKDGEDYNLGDDGIAHDAYRIGGNYSRFANMLVCHPFEGCTENAGSKLAGRYNNAVVLPYVGFGFNSSGVSDIYGKIESVMTSHLFTGYSSAEESLAALDKKLTEAGIDKFLEEYNGQYREWRNNQ